MIENLTPQQAFAFMQENPGAVMIDVRTKVEHGFVGHPLSAVHVPWKESPDWQVNSQFVEQVKAAVNNDLARPVLLLCRSGQRSFDAAQALEEAGFAHSINILDGFEGALDDNKHRGNLSGWRFCQLPWEQS